MAERDDTVLLDQKLEDRLFRALMAYDKLPRLVAGVLKPEDFSSQVKHRLFQVLMFHWGEYDSVPTRDVLSIEIEEMFGAGTTLVERYLDKIEDIPVPEWDWIVMRVDDWARTIRFHKALYQASDILRSGKRVDAEHEILKAIRSPGMVSGGQLNELEVTTDDLLDTVEDSNLLVCPTRIYALDALLKGGMFREELFLILAPLNVGKSWGAIHLGEAGLISGRHVLHISGEMNRQRVLQRYYGMFSGMVRPQTRDEIYREVELWDEAYDDKELHKVKSLLHVGELKDQIDNVRSFGGKLSVRSYPSGALTLNDVEREIMVFDASFDHPPDLVIVDAMTDMDVAGDSDTRRVRFGDIAKGLRRMAQEHHLAMIVTHQGNRQSLSAEIVEAEHTGESLIIVQVADTAVSFNQDRREQALGLMRIHLMRARNAKKWGMVEAYQNLDIGQFCQVSRMLTVEDMASRHEDQEQSEGGKMPEEDGIRRRLDRKRFTGRRRG